MIVVEGCPVSPNQIMGVEGFPVRSVVEGYPRKAALEWKEAEAGRRSEERQHLGITEPEQKHFSQWHSLCT